MTKKIRPAIVCFVKVAADVPMEEFAPVFIGKECHLEFFLHLPQTTTTAQLTDQGKFALRTEAEALQEGGDHENAKTFSMFASSTAQEDEDESEEGASRPSAFSGVERTPKKKKSSKRLCRRRNR